MEVEWGVVLQMLLVTLINVFVPILAGATIILVKNLIVKVKASVDAEKLAYVEALVESLVLAAEQSGLSGELSKIGAEKKAWVIQRLEEELAKRGIKMDVKMLSDLVEAAVWRSF